jgi:hypothetical protein
MNQRAAAVTLTVICLTASLSLGAEPNKRSELGRSQKLRILVDKVMQPEANWVTEEWMIRETADADFNVYSPRLGHDRLDEVRRVSVWCEKHGIYHMPWMRGSLSAPKDASADGKRMLWENGIEQPLWSPNSDEFWQWTARYVVEYAKMSVTDKHLIGVFLDYENYAPGRRWNLYSLSYDDLILGRFAKARGVRLPKLEPEARKAWLESENLHAAFAEFQVAAWRQRCRELREAVDEHNPTFQFCIYPAPGTPFMVEAAYPEWATERAPIILADASVYGRPSKMTPQKDALNANRKKLEVRMEIPEAAGIPFIHTGGIDPVVRGADPEFSGKNAVMISEATDGYWIFYEGPKYKEDHRDYWKWFTWANRAIASGDFQVQHEPRENPESWGFEFFDKSGAQVGLTAPKHDGRVTELPKLSLRSANVLVLGCQKGQPVEVELQNIPVSNYENTLVWDVRNCQLEKVASGEIPHGKTGTVRFTPDADGICLLAATSGQCAYRARRANVPVGLFSGEGLQVIRGAERLYFNVPANIKQIELNLKTAGAETARAVVFDAEGNEVASGQTTLTTSSVRIPVPVESHAGKTWSLRIEKADEGVLEDWSVRLGKSVPNVLSFTPDAVFSTAD